MNLAGITANGIELELGIFPNIDYRRDLVGGKANKGKRNAIHEDTGPAKSFPHLLNLELRRSPVVDLERLMCGTRFRPAFSLSGQLDGRCGPTMNDKMVKMAITSIWSKSQDDLRLELA